MFFPSPSVPAGVARRDPAASLSASRLTRRRRAPLGLLGGLAVSTAISGCHGDVTTPDQEQLKTANPIECVVQVSAKSMTCASSGASLSRAPIADGVALSLAPASGATLSILGNQDRYVRLLTSHIEYSPAAGRLLLAMAVQNLTGQPLGTVDGITATSSGIQTFVTDGPTVVAGSGTVRLSNPDGTATLAKPDQPFFTYAQLLQGNAISEVRGWSFEVAPTVQSFRFQVLVRASVPDESKPPAVPTTVAASAIATGGDRACAVRTGAGLYCWGRNVAATSPFRFLARPRREVALPGISNIGVGNADHVCAVNADGMVYCWGNNGYGQIGDGTAGLPGRFSSLLVRPMPVAAQAPAARFTEVAVGRQQTCALAIDGSVWCWGLYYGLLPAQVPLPASGRFVHVEVNTSQGCALTDTGAIYCWNGSATPAPELVASSAPFTQMSLGGAQLCALSATGDAYCGGSNTNGQAGDGTVISRPFPIPVAAPAGVRFKQISAGVVHTCAITNTGAAYCWGLNYDGQIGDGTKGADRLIPTRVSGIDGTPLTQVSAGFTRTCAVSTAGALLCWGSNRLDPKYNTVEMIDEHLTPTAVPLPGGATAAEAHVMDSNVCVRSSRMLVFCWGFDDVGQLGIDDPTATAGEAALRPLQVSPNMDIASVFAGGFRTCFATAGGALSCWSPDSTAPRSIAQTIKVAQVAIGDGHACEIAEGGAVWCWGRNTAGQLATSNLTLVAAAPLPVTLPAGTQFTSIAAGGDFSCGLGASGLPLCWGRNDGGQLGNGAKVFSQPQPAAVTMPAGVTFKAIAAGLYHACGLSPSGIAYCWGRNYYGQLGIGSFTDSILPAAVAMPAQTTFAQIAASGDRTCALTAAGEAWCWGGFNNTGELGTGDRNPRATPAQVATTVRFAQLALGFNSTCGRTSAGATYCWGWHGYGQIGDGTTSDRYTPSAVISP